MIRTKKVIIIELVDLPKALREDVEQSFDIQKDTMFEIMGNYRDVNLPKFSKGRSIRSQYVSWFDGQVESNNYKGTFGEFASQIELGIEDLLGDRLDSTIDAILIDCSW